MDLSRLFDKISGIINSMERAFIDLLSALVPYAVPIIPAYLTYYHTIDAMDFPEWVAKTTAFVVEVLGIASVSTAIRFYENNKRYKDKNRQAPFWLALGTYVFYLVVVLSVNVLLEVDAALRRPVIIWAIALFTLLSVPSGVLISIRSQFTEMLENKVRRTSSTPAITANAATTTGVRVKHASAYRDKIWSYLDANYKDDSYPKLTDISKKFGLEHSKSKGYLSTLRTEWKRSNGRG